MEWLRAETTTLLGTKERKRTMAKVRPLASVRACGALEVASGSMALQIQQHALRDKPLARFLPSGLLSGPDQPRPIGELPASARGADDVASPPIPCESIDQFIRISQFKIGHPPKV